MLCPVCAQATFSAAVAVRNKAGKFPFSAAAEAGQGSRFASDAWSYQTRIGAKRLSGYRVWRNAAAVGVRRGKGRGQRTRGHFAAQPLGAEHRRRV